MPDNSVLDLTELATLQRTDYVYVIRPDVGNPTSQDFKAKLSAIENLVETLTSVEVSVDGAAPINKDMVAITNPSLSVVNLTLSDGSDGQEILFVTKTMTSNVVLTPTNFVAANITFTLIGQTTKLKFITDKWYVLSNYGATIA